MRDGQADLHPRLIGLYGLAFADALHLARIQRIQLVFVVALMCANAFGGLKPRHQLCECQRVGVDDHWRRALALCLCRYLCLSAPPASARSPASRRLL